MYCKDVKIVSTHLSARHVSVLVPAHVKLIQYILAWHSVCADGLLWQSYTHHKDLLTVWRLAHHEGIVLQVCYHWHECSAAATPPPLPLPQQGSSEQSRAHCEGNGGGEWHSSWTLDGSGGLQLWTIQESH